MSGPGQLATPRGAHLEMVGAVLAGEGLRGVARIAARYVGAPVAIVVPRLGVADPGWKRFEQYVVARSRGADPEPPDEVTAEVPIVSGGQRVGSVLLLGEPTEDPSEYLQMAAIAALTEVAVADAREETAQSLRGAFLERVLRGEDTDGQTISRSARRLGCDLADGYVALCADPGGPVAGRVIAAVRSERPDAIVQAIDGRVYALVPGEREPVERLAARLPGNAVAGVSSRYRDAGEARRALEEAELVLEVKAAGGEVAPGAIADGAYRLLFRALVSHPEEVLELYERTVAPLVRYDEQYGTQLVATLSSYLEHNCNMQATATAIHTHRHTVAYRLDRVRELTGLDPLVTDHRERLSLGLKAYRVLAPRLPR
ncbi:helix-turn-helix domain-containing protein [Thermoleophilum album]|uniref:PucR family transcriptional regulator n=1 Tax=Thermoleophilum album TaxID=29539 RepID=UPI00237CCB71|nr:helix-turn-helix domain-containing protein [Thermoleophilum album]WDT93167.1 helix-turn-helix domain-containing protein [Thermoleophilum album]